MYGNSFCQVGNEEATRFCCCRGHVTVLCDRCVPTHEKQCPNEIHSYELVAYLSTASSLGIDEFQRRKMWVMSGMSLMRSLQEVEERQYQEAKRKVQETAQLYTQWLDYLHTCFINLTERFNQEKQYPLYYAQVQLSAFTSAVLNAGVTSVPADSVLVEAQPVEHLENELNEMNVRMYSVRGAHNDFDDYYAALIAQFAGGLAGNKMSLSSALSLPQRVAVSAAPTSRPSHVYVPFSRGRLLAKWRSDNQELDKVVCSRSLDFTNLTVSVVLSDGNMICCGGKDQHECRVLHIDTTSGDVVFLPEMPTARGNPGIAFINNVLYVLGGFNGAGTDLDTGEKLDLQTKQWTKLRNRMINTRFQFTPFPHNRTIYIAGGWHTTAVEAFDLSSETFTALPLVLPKQFGTVCLVYNNELVVLQDQRVIRWPLNSRSGNTQSQSQNLSIKDSNVVVQILGSKAYYSNEYNRKCEVHELDLTTWQVSKVADLSNGSNGGNAPCPVS